MPNVVRRQENWWRNYPAAPTSRSAPQSKKEAAEILFRSLGRRRPVLHVPTPIVSRALRLLERLWGSAAIATWDEAELMEVAMTSMRGAADAEALGGVEPQRMAAVLGTS